MRDEALDAAERLGQREALQAVDERAHAIVAAGDLERNDRAEPALLATRDVVARMRRQARVVHLLHGRLRLQPLRQAQRIAGRAHRAAREACAGRAA